MIRIVTIIWRVCNRLAKFLIDYLILYKAFQSLTNLVHHFDGKAVGIERFIQVQVLEVKAGFPVCKAPSGCNVHAVVGADITSDNSWRDFYLLKGELVAVETTITRSFALQKTKISFSCQGKSIVL